MDEEDTATADKDYAVAATGDDVDYSTVDDNTGASTSVPYVDLGNTQVRPDRSVAIVLHVTKRIFRLPEHCC